MVRTSHSILWKALAVIAAAVLWCQPARAQFGGGMGDMSQFMVPVTKKSVESYAQMVGMDSTQKEAAIALQEGYRSSFKQMQEGMQKSMKELQEKFQDTQDMSVWTKEAPKIGKEFTEKMEKLENGFMDDVKALLTDPQKEKWPRVERARRRDRGLRFAMVSGQNVDLVKMLQSLNVNAESSADLNEQVVRYEVEMDKQIQAFEKWGKEQQAKQVEGDMMQNFDMAKIQDMLKEMTGMCKGMRDTNKQYAKSISAMLTPEQQAKFDMEIKKKSFPRVYKDSYPTRAMGEAMKFSDLDASQTADLTALRGSYERELADVNKRWAAAIEEREEKQGGVFGAMMAGFGGGERDSKDGVGEARKSRKDLDSRTKEKLNSILKEEQRKRLPEDKPDPKDNGFNFFDIEPVDQDE